MISDYRFFIYEPDGTLRASLTNVRYCNFSKHLRTPGGLEIAIPISDSYAPAKNDIIDVNLNYSPSNSRFVGIYSGERRRLVDGLGESRILNFAGLTSLLYSIINAYTAGYSSRSYFSSSNSATALFNILTYNFSSGTTGSGRLRNSDYQDIQAIVNGSTSHTVTDFYCAYKNLHDIAAELSGVGGWDFTADRNVNARIVIEASGLGSDNNVSLITGDHIIPDETRVEDAEERTVAIVGGGGTGSSRTTSIRTSSDYIANEHGRELFVDARDLPGTSLDERGDAVLSQEVAKVERRYRLVPSPAVRIDDNVNLGDTVLIDGDDNRITAIEYRLSGAETIHIRAEAV